MESGLGDAMYESTFLFIQYCGKGIPVPQKAEQRGLYPHKAKPFPMIIPGRMARKSG